MLNPYDHTSKQNVSQFGAAFESELRLLNDKLGLYFYTGGATGDSEAEGLSSDANFIDAAGASSTNPLNNNRVSTFRFHPAYRVDLILWRNILGAVTGAYYFKPGISYDFVKDTFGQLIGARVDAIWSRASAPVQTWGNNPNLGVEIDAQVYWRSGDWPQRERRLPRRAPVRRAVPDERPGVRRAGREPGDRANCATRARRDVLSFLPTAAISGRPGR